MHPDCYRVDLPYPCEMPTARSPRLAALLLPACVDELKSVSNYLYLSLRAEQTLPTCSVLFSAVAETELQHFRLLGRLILSLGGDPVIRTRLTCGPITTEPDRSIGRLLEASMHHANRAADRYRRLQDACSDPAVAAILRRIQLDEECHASAFAQMLRQ